MAPLRGGLTPKILKALPRNFLTLTVNSKLIHLQQAITLLLHFPRITWLTL